MTAANTMIAKIAAVLAVAGLVASSVVAFTPVAGAQTATASATFTRDLTIGSTGADVTALQNWLINKGYAIAAGATGYFGAQTQAALAKYQAAKNISPAAGYFGPITRAAVAADGGSTGGNTGGDSDSDSDDELSGGEANLTSFDLRAEDADGNEGEEGVEIATAEFDVEDGDVRVERLEVEFDATGASTLSDRPWQYFDTLYVMVDGDEVGEIDASDRDEWDETTANVYEIVFTGLDYVVEEGDEARLTIAADIASSIDSAELAQDFDVTVNDEGVRAVDAEGIQQYTGDSTDTISFGFGAEENGDLNLQSTDEDPNASVIVADDTEISDEYSVFVFEIENDQDVDSILTDLEIGVIASTSATSTMADDVIRTATLVVDGDEFDGDIAAGTIDFQDIDVTIGGDETLTLELMIELAAQSGNYAATGETLAFRVYSSQVTAEGEASGDDATVEGTVTSATHSIALTGVAVEPVSTSQSVVTPGTSASASYGTYTVKFDVTALDERAYIADSAATTTTNGVEFDIFGSTYNGTTTAVLTSTATLSGGYYVVQDGETETFTMTVTLDPSAAGTFGVKLEEVNFNDAAAAGDTTFTVDASEDEFRTDAVYIAN